MFSDTKMKLLDNLLLSSNKCAKELITNLTFLVRKTAVSLKFFLYVINTFNELI